MTGWVIARADEARVGLMFLTALPTGRVQRSVPLGATAWSWPLVGAVIGAIFGLTHWAATSLGLGASVAFMLSITVSVLATGAIHEDGLADLADGIGGGPDPQRRLEIMRDSRMGSYGAIALILAFLTAFALWSEARADGVAATAIAVGAVSRMALPLWLGIMPAARKDGLGAQTADQLGARAVFAFVIGAGVAVLTLPLTTAAAAIAACLCGQLAVCLYARARLGGVTGDVMGAAQVIGSLAALMMAVA